MLIEYNARNKEIVPNQNLVFYSVLDDNLEEAQYILRFKGLRDCMNRKITLCHAYNQVLFENEGVCVYVPKC